MKIYRPKTDTYVVAINNLPYEVTKEDNLELHLELEKERLFGEGTFEIDLQEELPAVPKEPTEMETLQQELANTNAMLLEFMESILM